MPHITPIPHEIKPNKHVNPINLESKIQINFNKITDTIFLSKL